MSGTTSASVWVSRPASPRASELGRKSSSCAAASTRSRKPGRTGCALPLEDARDRGDRDASAVRDVLNGCGQSRPVTRGKRFPESAFLCYSVLDGVAWTLVSAEAALNCAGA